MSMSKSVKIRHLRYVGHLCITFHNPFGNPSCVQAAEFIINNLQTRHHLMLSTGQLSHGTDQ